jgi:hypothetical protein
MRRRKNRETVWEALVPLVVLAVGLSIAACQLLPQTRAMVQAAGQVFLLVLVIVVVGTVLVLGIRILVRIRGRRMPVPITTLPRARVVHFPPQAGAESDLKYQPPPHADVRATPGVASGWEKVRASIPSYPQVSSPCPAPPSPPRPTAPAVPTTQELVDKLRRLDWFQFEKVTEVVYQGLGYWVTRRGGANPDGGIDLIIEKDGQKTAIQCKHWKAWKVRINHVREFLGALTHAQISAGIFITLAGYTEEAKQFAQTHNIELLTDTGLAQLMDRAGARFNPEIIAALNERRKFCPKCDVEMVLRTAGKGKDVGSQFWGCPNYPRCRQIISFAE